MKNINVNLSYSWRTGWQNDGLTSANKRCINLLFSSWACYTDTDNCFFDPITCSLSFFYICLRSHYVVSCVETMRNGIIPLQHSHALIAGCKRSKAHSGEIRRRTSLKFSTSPSAVRISLWYIDSCKTYSIWRRSVHNWKNDCSWKRIQILWQGVSRTFPNWPNASKAEETAKP